MNGMEEDLLASLRRDESELPGLHGAKEESKTTRRGSRMRPKLHVKTEQVNRIACHPFTIFSTTEELGHERAKSIGEEHQRGSLARGDNYSVEEEGTLPDQVRKQQKNTCNG